MRPNIQNKLRSALLESMPDEDIGTIKITIPFDRLVIDGLNLKWAINNIKQKRPSRSKDNPMQIAIDGNGKFYLLDGYHRLVEFVLAGKKNTTGIGLNKSYEELKKLDKIGVGCQGGTGDKFCNNFKTTASIEDIINNFK